MLASNDSDNDMDKRREFVTMTFRINRNVVERFRAESETSGISMNVLVNQVLCHYVEWDSFEPRIGMIPFPKTVLGKIFYEMKEDQIVKLASSVGKDTAIDMAMFMKGRMDALMFISWVEARMRNSGFEIVHRVDNAKDIHTVTIKHDLGKNWSLYLRTMLQSILVDIFKKQSEFVVSDSMLLVSFSS
jgi:hypothetical protein